MKAIKNHILTLIAITAVACSTPTTDNSIQKLQVDPDSDQLDSFLDMVGNIKIIPLELNNQALIGGIAGVEVYRNNIYVLDLQFTKSVFIFNTKGAHFKTIRSIGKGPGEYIFPIDIAIDPFNEFFVIIDSDGKKVIRYDLDGNYLSEDKLDFAPHAIGFIDKKTYVFKTMSRDRIPIVVSTNQSGKTQNVLHKSIFEFNRSLFSHFPRIGDLQLCNEYLNDTIYRVDKEKFYPYLYIDFLDHKVEAAVLDQYRSEVRKSRNLPRLNKNQSGGIRCFLENDDFTIIGCNLLGKFCWVINDNNSKKQVKLSEAVNGTTSVADMVSSLYSVDNHGHFVADKIEIEGTGFVNQAIISPASNPIIVLLKLNSSK